MSTTTNHDDSALRRAYGAVAATGLLSVVVAGSWAGAAWALSVAAGSAVALGNLWVLARAVRNLLAAESQGAAVPWSLVAVLKFFALMAVTYWLVKSPLVQPLGLAFGFLALPVGIVVGTVLQDPRRSSGRRLNGETDHA